MGISTNSSIHVVQNGVVHEVAPWGTVCCIHAMGVETDAEINCMTCLVGISPSKAENFAFQYGMDLAIMKHLGIHK